IAKMINVGIVYGISAFGLSENLEIPREEAQAYIDAYLARFPHVQDFIQRTIEQARGDGYTTSLLGRRRPVPELRASNRQTRSLGERLAVNFCMQVALPDGYNLNVEEVGAGYPLIVLHGGPGLDHSMFRPYLDALGDEYRVLYVDERGQGRSQRVDPATLSLEVFARDVDLLAETLDLDGFVVLGHSFGAIITTYHATELGTAAAYVISAGGDSSASLEADVAAALEALG